MNRMCPAGLVGRARLLLMAALMLLSSPAKADDPSLHVVFGWAGQMTADRWSPITVHINAADRPLAGHVVVEYVQDTFQHARIMAPFAAAAGTSTPTQVLVCLPGFCDRLDIRLFDERGRRLASASYVQGGGPRSGVLPPLVSSEAGLIVNVGRPLGGGLPEAFRIAHAGWMTKAEDPYNFIPRAEGASEPRELPWGGITAVSVPPADLPTSHMAYDGIMVLVVPTDAAMEVSQTSLAAVRQWVLAGGSLLVVADSPGEYWRNWLPPESADLVSLAPVERSPLPQELASAVAAVNVEAGRESPVPATSLNMRQVQLTERARQEGWRVRYATDPGAGPMASGPVGLGIVTILGFDPQRTSAAVSAPAAAAVWREVLQERASEFFVPAARTPGFPGFMWVEPSQQAINEALEMLADLPVLGFTMFWIIAGALGLLAALVGPVDYFVLRRLGGLQRSWLTAVVWILLAAMVAAGAPRFIRTDPTHVSRLTVVDQLQEDDGSVAAAASTSLTGIYAGHGGSLVLEGVDPASWWAGVSVRQPYRGEGPRGRAPLPMVQQAAGGKLGSTRGNPVHHLPMAQWTFRTFLDHSLHGAALRARVEEGDDGGRVTISGLPDGGTIRTLLIRTGDGLYRVHAQRSDGDAWTGRYVANDVADEELLKFIPSEFGQRSRRNRLLPAALALPGPYGRAPAAQHRVDSRNWAALYLEVEGWPPHPIVNDAARYDHTLIARILIPLGTP
jgi:hypothetical protein